MATEFEDIKSVLIFIKASEVPSQYFFNEIQSSVSLKTIVYVHIECFHLLILLSLNT